MSVNVDLDRLAETLADFPFAYLITVGDDFHAHTVAVDPVLRGGVFDVGNAGKTTRANLAQHGDVTLLWPPRERGGYSLIVDGHALCPEENVELVVVPRRAVLHRRATSDSPPQRPGCVDDCIPLES
ncbi:pyridoxamine 5'-phosphate oxidase family protein [Mycolicibacterium sp. CH28]|uniref:pyridoxamine 5'-phosphate oxidase family protein n=1 Tax=Mycolicibacterium sp. CH28 TaxID=2512237 RepID=UPI001081B5B4|nr:pyridoxamine 5'-phosphate oxidase family protein [Mycolicibacterium sp. CH28]TGD89013.1 pyridoxamine 5'-phosphate oxidase family protein [Mycolicibacterium sp. CH28]